MGLALHPELISQDPESNLAKYPYMMYIRFFFMLKKRKQASAMAGEFTFNLGEYFMSTRAEEL